RDIARHIAGAAQHALRPFQQQHRYRRFRRNPLGVAIGKAVEHQIAKTQDRGLGKVHLRFTIAAYSLCDIYHAAPEWPRTKPENLGGARQVLPRADRKESLMHADSLD